MGPALKSHTLVLIIILLSAKTSLISVEAHRFPRTHRPSKFHAILKLAENLCGPFAVCVKCALGDCEMTAVVCSRCCRSFNWPTQRRPMGTLALSAAGWGSKVTVSIPLHLVMLFCSLLGCGSLAWNNVKLSDPNAVFTLVFLRNNESESVICLFLWDLSFSKKIKKLQLRPQKYYWMFFISLLINGL